MDGASAVFRNSTWENLITGECRVTPPVPGEVDWREIVGRSI
jgi:hypothetical protein